MVSTWVHVCQSLSRFKRNTLILVRHIGNGFITLRLEYLFHLGICPTLNYAGIFFTTINIKGNSGTTLLINFAP